MFQASGHKQKKTANMQKQRRLKLVCVRYPLCELGVLSNEFSNTHLLTDKCQIDI